MPKSLAELRKSPHVGLPETEFPLCVAGKLNAEFDRIDTELDELIEAQRARPRPKSGDDSDTTGPPARLGSKGRNPRINQLNARREELRAEMVEHTVTLLLRARGGDLWRAWVNEHPEREDHRLDRTLGFNVDALTDDIRDHPREYVAEINGDSYSDDDWKFVWGNAGDGDKWRLTAAVRGLHQSGVDVPKSLTGWLENQTRGSSSR